MTKDDILREIQRTAEANGGAPLGKGRFAQQTGIRPHDWGRFWARWGDAIRDAGFQPNTLQRAYSEDELFEKYARLVRRLGHVPSGPELRLEAHNDPEFPGRTIQARFRQPVLVKRIAEHFENQREFEDVVRLCRQYTERNRPLANEEKQSGVELGYVYLFKSGRYFKIGRSNAAGRREYEVGIQLPEKITTVHIIKTDDPAGIEAYWHRRFDAKRKKGEWFQLTPSDVSAFRLRKFM